EGLRVALVGLADEIMLEEAALCGFVDHERDEGRTRERYSAVSDAIQPRTCEEIHVRDARPAGEDVQVRRQVVFERNELKAGPIAAVIGAWILHREMRIVVAQPLPGVHE